MSWNAKRTGGYDVTDPEFTENVQEIYNILSTDAYLVGDQWSYEAIVGFLCNVYQECKMNPWVYNGSRYGLVQFLFSYYETNGSSYSNYAPSTSPSATQDDAQPTDGIAQLQVIDSPHNTLYLANQTRMNKARQLGWAILEWDDLQSYKICDDIDQAIQSWLLFYEYPTSTISGLQYEFELRKSFQQAIEDAIGGTPPVPPVPPPHPTTSHKMPLYFYTLKKFKYEKGIL